MTFVADKTDTPALIKRWEYDFQEISEGEPFYEYLGAYVTELHQIDVFIDELYEQRFIDTATNRELEKLAASVGITRQANEDDEELRFRAKLRKAVAASDGTPEDIETIMQLAFGEETLEDIEVLHSAGAPVTQFRVPSPSLDDIPLSRADFESEVERAFPAGYGVEIVESDTWLLGESGNQGLGEGALI
jgi:hypothetical protein